MSVLTYFFNQCQLALNVSYVELNHSNIEVMTTVNDFQRKRDKGKKRKRQEKTLSSLGLFQRIHKILLALFFISLDIALRAFICSTIIYCSFFFLKFRIIPSIHLILLILVFIADISISPHSSVGFSSIILCSL